MDDRLSRRSVLRAGAALAATGALAGCNAPLLAGERPDLGYTDWLYAPGAADLDAYEFVLLRPAALAERREDIGPVAYDPISGVGESVLDLLDVEFEAVESLLFTGANRAETVLTGEYDVGSVRAELGYDDFRQVGEVESAAVYLAPDGTRAVAVMESYLAVATGTADPQAAVERFVETQAGELARYTDVSRDVGRLVEALGDGTVLLGAPDGGVPRRDDRPGRFEGQVASGITYRLPEEGERVELLRPYVFEDEDVPVDEVTGFVEENRGTDEAYDDVKDIDVGAEGRTVLVRGRLDLADFAEGLLP